MALRRIQGAPTLHALLKDIVGPPGPPCNVPMLRRGPIKGLSRVPHLIRDLVAEVLVVGPQGPLGHKVPHEPVCIGTTNVARVRKEHEVQHGLVIKLQDLEDEVPKVQRILAMAKLDEVSFPREVLMQELEVVPLKVLEGRAIKELEPPKGREGLCRWNPGPLTLLLLLGLRCLRLWCSGPPLP